MNFINILHEEFRINKNYIDNIINLINQGNTIPFIARYRKELTGGIDDQVLRELDKRYVYLQNLENRKKEIIAFIQEQDKLTETISSQIKKSEQLSELEEIYRPFKSKRKTKASIAKEKGLDDLAINILEQKDNFNIDEDCLKYISQEKEIYSANDAINYAKDIISENISTFLDIRKEIKDFIYNNGLVICKCLDKEDEFYNKYDDFSENIKKIPPHRILAINRGEKLKKIKISIYVDNSFCNSILEKHIIIRNNISSEIVKGCIKDSYSRLIFPSIEREIRSYLTNMAIEKSLILFNTNLKQLLMQPPLKENVILGFDPGFRTGCKLAIIDKTGKVLYTGVIYPTPPLSQIEKSSFVIIDLIKKYNINIIAIGNGTASRESELFISNILKENNLNFSYVIVNESGASVYSASKIGAEEFPDFDVSLRSAVSIARRIQDPLSELVKIDSRSIGVGQYQHDIASSKLDESLNSVVEDCVNSVGVNLNTASYCLLAKISGLNLTIAKNIVEFRDNEGKFTDRKKLLSVKKLGKKTFEQAAGFLKILDGDHFLDRTVIHPESYEKTSKLLSIVGYTLDDIENGKINNIWDNIRGIGLEYIIEKTGLGKMTIIDIIDALKKPTLDPREEYPQPLLRSDILEIKDLKIGMILQGVVRNIVDFGAFVDIGVHHDGLVHISAMSEKFIKTPLEIVSIGDIIKVTIIELDKERISLSLL